jgi:hypothetical protein
MALNKKLIEPFLSEREIISIEILVLSIFQLFGSTIKSSSINNNLVIHDSREMSCS